jgi:hypothetical protein
LTGHSVRPSVSYLPRVFLAAAAAAIALLSMMATVLPRLRILAA